jgi:hypothetical protein
VAVVLWDVGRALSYPWPPTRLYEYLYASGNNEGLGVILFTLPTCSAVGYSVGMLIGTWIRASKAEQPISRRLMASVVLSAAFLVSFAVMQTAGKQMVERDLKVRIAVGGPIAVDGNELCRLELNDRLRDGTIRSGGITVTTSTPPHTIDVLGGVRLESLGAHICKEGRVVDADEPIRRNARGDSSVLERVRVLDGSNQGKEGWISTFRFGDRYESNRTSELVRVPAAFPRSVRQSSAQTAMEVTG